MITVPRTYGELNHVHKDTSKHRKYLNFRTDETMSQRGLNKGMVVCKSVYWSRQHLTEQ